MTDERTNERTNGGESIGPFGLQPRTKRKKKQRSRNLVIHGYAYQDDQEDVKLIVNFIKTMSVGVVKPKSLSRIGKDINPGKNAHYW